VLVWVVTVLSFVLAAAILPGFFIDTGIDSWQLAVLRWPVVFALLLIVLRPLLLFLTLPMNGLTLGLPTLLFNGLILYFTARLEPAIQFQNVGDAFVASFIITVVSTAIVSWLGLDEAYPFYQSLLYRLGRRLGPKGEGRPTRGLLILQIDGLSYPSLDKVLDLGRMPTLSAMLAKGTHRLFRWQCGIPSNTPAVQGGMLYGTRENVPGYRWFDRRQQRLRVVSNPADLRDLEAMVAADGDPLLENGSCINSFLSGGAAKRLLTVSALGIPDSERQPGEKIDFNLFFFSPNAYTKAVLNGAWDFLAGTVLAVFARLRRSRPQLKPSIKRIAQQAIANSFLRDLSFFWLKQDISRGVPIIYSNFVGYDDVAHYSDPDAYEAQVTLAAFDRRLRRLRRRALHHKYLNYELVVLSDHGQTRSIPYRLLYGEKIEDTLAGLLGELQVRGDEGTRDSSPDASYVASMLAELEQIGDTHLGWAADRGVRAMARIEHPPPLAVSTRTLTTEKVSETSVVVCVSGSLAHIYFAGHEQALHLEEVLDLYPGIVDQLARHPGVGFVAASRQFGDAVAVCDGGIRNLITGEVGGERDPLAPYGEPDRWAGELAQLLGFPDSGDLLINGSWLPERDRIVVFEEQISSHGGLGGRQTEPFVILPADWRVEAMDLESPEALHFLLQRNRPRL